MKLTAQQLARFGLRPAVKAANKWKAGWRVVGDRRKYFRSRWEANYARYLEWQRANHLIRDWDHECQTFWFDGVKRGCVAYLPDFKVTHNDGGIEFHEVKGWMDPKSRTKLRRMGKYHPNVRLRVVDAKWYRANAGKLSKIIKEWE